MKASGHDYPYLPGKKKIGGLWKMVEQCLPLQAVQELQTAVQAARYDLLWVP